MVGRPKGRFACHSYWSRKVRHNKIEGVVRSCRDFDVLFEAMDVAQVFRELPCLSCFCAVEPGPIMDVKIPRDNGSAIWGTETSEHGVDVLQCLYVISRKGA